MECTLALVADAANRAEGGKLNVLGVFSQISAAKFPYVHPQLHLVVSFRANPAEFGLKKDVEIVLLDPDGQPVGGRMKAKASVPTPPGASRASIELVLRLVNVPFQKPGSYAFSALVAGEEKASIPIEVIEIKKPTGRPKRGK